MLGDFCSLHGVERVVEQKEIATFPATFDFAGDFSDFPAGQQLSRSTMPGDFPNGYRLCQRLWQRPATMASDYAEPPSDYPATMIHKTQTANSPGLRSGRSGHCFADLPHRPGRVRQADRPKCFFPRDRRAGAALISPGHIKSPRICPKDARHGDIGAKWYRIAPNIKCPQIALKRHLRANRKNAGRTTGQNKSPPVRAGRAGCYPRFARSARIRAGSRMMTIIQIMRWPPA